MHTNKVQYLVHFGESKLRTWCIEEIVGNVKENKHLNKFKKKKVYLVPWCDIISSDIYCQCKDCSVCRICLCFVQLIVVAYYFNYGNSTVCCHFISVNRHMEGRVKHCVGSGVILELLCLHICSYICGEYSLSKLVLFDYLYIISGLIFRMLLSWAGTYWWLLLEWIFY